MRISYGPSVTSSLLHRCSSRFVSLPHKGSLKLIFRVLLPPEFGNSHLLTLISSYAPTPATTWIMDNSAPYDSRVVLWLVHKTTNQARSALLDPIRLCHLWLQAEKKAAPRVSSLLCSRAEWLDYPQIPGSSFGAVWGCCFVHICLVAIVTVTILLGTPKCDRRNS